MTQYSDTICVKHSEEEQVSGSLREPHDLTAGKADASLTKRDRKSIPPPPLPPPPRARRNVLRWPALDGIEDVKTYRFGGHHPVTLGDVIGDRFRILHKLGNGGFAIVWLARDLEKRKYVALKILRADASHHETHILEHIKKTVDSPRIAHLRATFSIKGPNGVHQCLVLELGGPSLGHLSLYRARPAPSFLRLAGRKLAEGLAALHAAGICHGDLSHNNVLFTTKGIQDWSEEDLYGYLGQPVTAPLLLLDGSSPPPSAPPYVVQALNFSDLAMDQISNDVLIVDFGEAFFMAAPPPGLGTPASFSAPELLFEYAPSLAADLWALGCLIFEMHAFRVLMPTMFGSPLEGLAMAMETIGPIPFAWRELYYDKEDPLILVPGESHRWFDDQIERTRTLTSQLRELMPELSQEEHALFVELLERMLVFEPSCRMAAAEVVEHPWFTNKS